MAMIKCAECGKEFSDRANACPNCGCPIEYQAEKSIGGEYHAADKLAPSVIVEHLTIAKELESERYTLQMTIPQITNRINQLGYRRSFKSPVDNRVKAFFIGALIFLIFAINGFVILTSIGAKTDINDIMSSAENGTYFDYMKKADEAFENRKRIYLILAVPAVIAGGILTTCITNSKYKKAVKQYNNLVCNDNARVNYENFQKQQLQLQKEDIQKKIGEISETLEHFYSLDIIHPKYRNMITVIRLLEYFDSGRCTALTGAGGAYNKYEEEIRQDAIISKLDTAINCLYQIRDTQYMLYESLEDCLDELGAITTQNDKLISTNQDISQNSAIAAYNSKIAASNSDALVFIEAYKGANGL